MEIWGLCPQCERWFYCEHWLDREAPSPVCPVCLVEPHAIENRADPPVSARAARREPRSDVA